MTDTVHLLTNPAAGRGRGVDSATAALRSHGVSVLVTSAATSYDAELAVHQLVGAGARRVVALGGDGLVHIAVQALACSDTVLGVIPRGTGNDFAGGMGIPGAIEEAAARALAPPGRVDLMRIGRRWAASVATCGFSVDVNMAANEMRWPRGPTRYTRATLQKLPALRARRIVLTIDGTDHVVDAAVVTVANTSDFGGGMKISPDADPTDGTLEVTVVGDVGRVELLRWFRRVFDGSHLDHPKVMTYRGTRITVAGDAGDVWADGEPVAASPATIEVMPGALLLAGA